MNQTVEELITFFSTPQNIVITMHRDPDADALGSSLGWASYLIQKGHAVTVISPTDYTANLAWLPGIEQVLIYERAGDQRICKTKIEEASLICCLDFSVLSRLKDLGKVVQDAKADKMMIDHHLEPEHFAKWMIWDTYAAATAQLVYSLIREMEPGAAVTDVINKSMAECLYAGIMTDTGSFRHANVTPEVHLAVADLMLTGFDASRVHRLIYDNAPLSRLQFLGYVLSQKLIVIPEFRTAYMVLTEAELIRYNSSPGETEGIVNYGLQVENVVMSALFIERKGEIKISFRSVGGFSVRDLASSHFSGGGHKNASGGRSEQSIKETVDRFLSVLPSYREALLSVD
ncbi:bifunctional oligoribonuclease/PAP phosphatase NrnA [Dyadobacter sp. CY312]|uniref:DHH family phosphoesterase n=1 Tax=Dyadobacter sp. CY312 TaxID=2907303 RepID=UPI001F36072D|nr:bifunctional oligoribonuclease/PAP phosphatase NrnA [Dyadobacter sp. CY312]MCE7043702.1 bifunctional oligoribonuclease/PAP phosphatase NrnA [Dyadobacter sp. CY312]